MCTPRGSSLAPLLSSAMVRCRWLMMSVAMPLHVFRYNSPCPFMPCPSPLGFLALHSLTLPCPAFPCPALPCSGLPCPAYPSPALPCPALPCPALLSIALPCPLPLALPFPSLPCPALPCPPLPLYVMLLSLLRCSQLMTQQGTSRACLDPDTAGS